MWMSPFPWTTWSTFSNLSSPGTVHPKAVGLSPLRPAVGRPVVECSAADLQMAGGPIAPVVECPVVAPKTAGRPVTERSAVGGLVAGRPIAPMRGRPSADYQALAALIPLCSRAVRLADASLKAARVVSLRLFQDRLISVCPFPSRLALQKMRGRLGRPSLSRPCRLRRPWRPPWARPGGVCPYPPWSPGRWPPVGPGVVWSPIPSRALWWMWAVPATGRPPLWPIWCALAMPRAPTPVATCRRAAATWTISFRGPVAASPPTRT